MFVLLYETAPPEIYTLSLHDALPISGHRQLEGEGAGAAHCTAVRPGAVHALGGQDARETLELRSEEHTSELQSHSDLVCRLLLEKKKRSTVRSTFFGMSPRSAYTCRC